MKSFHGRLQAPYDTGDSGAYTTGIHETRHVAFLWPSDSRLYVTMAIFCPYDHPQRGYLAQSGRAECTIPALVWRGTMHYDAGMHRDEQE